MTEKARVILNLSVAINCFIVLLIGFVSGGMGGIFICFFTWVFSGIGGSITFVTLVELKGHETQRRLAAENMKIQKLAMFFYFISIIIPATIFAYAIYSN